MPLNRSRVAGLLLASLALLPAHAIAQSARGVEFDVREFTCPIGGAKFSQDVGYASMPLVQFADGSWLGDVDIDVQIPECPGNGVLLIPDYEHPQPSGEFSYRDYTPEQLARLPGLLKGDEFLALRAKTRHERAQWLATQLGMPATTRFQLLVRASWTARDPAERKRLVSRIAAEGPALVDAFDAPEAERLPSRLLLANALRELGRFDEAAARLDAIRASIPADAGLKDPDAVRALGSALGSMYEAIESRDDDRFPIALSSEKWVSRACNGNDLPAPYGPTTPNAKAACERRQRERQARDDAFEQAMKLREDPQQLDRQCQATPADKRDAGLAQACAFAQDDRDKKTADELLLHSAGQVAADCEATSEQARKGPLFFACISYQTAVEGALAGLLAGDDAGYAIVCADGASPPDRAAFADLACSSAEHDRQERTIERLLADPVALDASCATNPTYEQGLTLVLACDRRRADKDRPAIEPALRVAADAPIHDPPERNIYHPDSALNQAARESAKRILADAKSNGTYPRRKPGDQF